MTDARPVLVLNCGSSSIKYQLIEPSSEQVLASGSVEKIGEATGTLKHRHGDDHYQESHRVADHGAVLDAIHTMFNQFGPALDDLNIRAVGHRIVHGGAVFRDPVIIDQQVIDQLRLLTPLAPLQNPPALAGLEAARRMLPDCPHVAVFDTAFFAALPAVAATYAIDRELAEKYGIRKYGFHGTSHQYVSGKVSECLGLASDGELNQIILHLGNGCSMSAIHNGVAVETSMGLTPLQGLVMGTRSGDIDPGMLVFLHREAGMSVDQIDTLLNKKSGLKGLAGVNDFRELLQLRSAGDEAAALAFDSYVHRLKLYLGGYLALLGGVDVVTFTAGVGENSPVLRAAVIDGLDNLGLRVSPQLNESTDSGPRFIHSESSGITIMVVPTNEELAIARAAVALTSAVST